LVHITDQGYAAIAETATAGGLPYEALHKVRVAVLGEGKTAEIEADGVYATDFLDLVVEAPAPAKPKWEPDASQVLTLVEMFASRNTNPVYVPNGEGREAACRIPGMAPFVRNLLEPLAWEGCMQLGSGQMGDFARLTSTAENILA